MGVYDANTKLTQQLSKEHGVSTLNQDERVLAVEKPQIFELVAPVI